jgi:hypothetical protein
MLTPSPSLTRGAFQIKAQTPFIALLTINLQHQPPFGGSGKAPNLFFLS